MSDSKTQEYSRIGWDELKNYPNASFRVYSGVLGCEDVAFIISRQKPGYRAGQEGHHLHENGEEICVLLEGKGRVFMGDDTVLDAKPHDAFRAPRGLAHSIENASDTEEAVWLVMGAPAAEWIEGSPDYYRPGAASAALADPA